MDPIDVGNVINVSDEVNLFWLICLLQMFGRAELIMQHLCLFGGAEVSFNNKTTEDEISYESIFSPRSDH